MAHNHNHEHSHSHGDHHGHSHAPASFGRAFAIGTALNLGFVIVEAVYVSGTLLPCLPIAGHNLSVLGLVLAWGASALARRRETLHLWATHTPQSWRL